MAKKPETTFKEHVLKDLKNLPKTWAVKIQQVAKRGTPDIFICMNGHFVALELKKDVAEARTLQNPLDLQRYTLEKIVDAGGTSVVAYPENWEGTLDYLVSKYLRGVKIEGEKIAH